ncbi:TRAP transporter small permease [Aurantimonas sp. VKM B-3413]|uniref:TRAP transporter small permease n=1 Tax=Aurantimonas sp. VKM B-3413 TaxID=2779401 RepID=UPI001E286954|nr:TRAP transporter small permease [Aurantimonas sp. VKM B-3413]MCB8840317.1 TRAP transporter small permease [Aurantimonas sp. VKM B-3413]
MGTFFKLVGWLSLALASLVKLILAAMVVEVVSDVVLRNLDYRPISWGVSATEYGLLYSAFLPMPWLVRTKGHVFVEFLRRALPPAGRLVLEKLVYALCIALSLYLTWYAFDAFLNALATGAYETKTFDMPKWLIFLPIAIGFFLSALEWSRYLLGHDSLYDVDILDREGL